jgi:hypothetical protein
MHDEAFYRDIVGALHRSAQFEKRAAAGDLTALQTKAVHDLDLLGRLKEAVEVAPLMNAAKRGLMFGGAATIPAVAGGSYLLHKAHKEREQTVEDIRNKALQVALGVGGIGAGLMGLHHALGSRGPANAGATAAPATPTNGAMAGLKPSPGSSPSQLMPEEMDGLQMQALSPEDMYALQALSPEELQMLFKQSSVDAGPTLQKLATVAYLEVLLEGTEQHEKTASVQRDMHALRLLNAEHGAQLLRELLGVA